MKSKKTKASTQKQADAMANAQLMAMFGETIESVAEIIKKIKKEKKSKKKK